MYAVSNRYVEKIMSNSIHSAWSGRLTTANGLTIPLTTRNIVASGSSIQSEISTGDSIEIGTTCASSLDLDIFLDYNPTTKEYSLNGETISRYDFFGGTVKLTYRLYFNDSEYEEIRCKTYNISKAERTSDILSIESYDNMLKFNKAFGPTGTGTGYQFLQYACNACGVTLGISAEEFEAMPNGRLQIFIHPKTLNQIKTWKDMVGYIAQLVGGVAYISFDDKLYIRQYGNVSQRTIPQTWRYSSVIADYDSFYTRLTGKYVLSENDTVVEIIGDGLTYDLGTNPFLQFDVEETRLQAYTAILNAISTKYTPFNVTCPLDPAFECGDVITLIGGQASNNLSVVTKMSYSLNGAMTLSCQGENPKLITTETTLDKRFDRISVTKDEDPIKYYDYTNTDDIEILDGQSKRVIIFRYGAMKNTRVELSAMILFYLDTTEIITDDMYDENSGWVKVSFYINGGLIDGYFPLEEYMDGEHILPIIYEFSTTPISIGTFEVWITMRGAKINIGQNQIRAYISGIGLIGEDAWNGTINVFDSINRFNVKNRFFRGATDSVIGSVHEPIGVSMRDNLGRITAQKIFRGFTDENESTGDVFVYTPTVNTEYIVTNASTENGRWLGAGSILAGTARYLITNDVKGVTHVMTKDLAIVYYASFDGGTTWKGYTNEGWIENAPMIQATIMAVTAEQWAEGGETVRIKALLETDTWLGSLNLYGGYIDEETEG